MKKPLNPPAVSAGELFKLPYEALKWELLKTAIQLKVFDGLSEPASASDTSSRLSIHPENTEYFLKALVSLECLTLQEGKYQNTLLSETYLKNGKETSIGESLLFMEHWMEGVLNGGMVDLVSIGPPTPEDFSREEVWERAARISINHSRCGRAQQIAAMVASLPEFPSLKTILDLGSGPGIIGVAVTGLHPSAHCTLFDQAAVCKVAKEVIAEYGMEDRVGTHPGDYMNDPIGEGYDLIMANYSLSFFREELDRVIAKVYSALNPGGVFFVTSDGMNAERTAPAASVISWLSTWLRGRDMSIGSGEIAQSMLRVGFTSTHVQLLHDTQIEAHGPVEVSIGRKV